MTIKFILRSKIKNKDLPIKLYFSEGKNNQGYLDTGLTIQLKDWDVPKGSMFGMPKKKITENKETFYKLTELEKYIEVQYKLAKEEGAETNKAWFQTQINAHFNRLNEIELNENLLTTKVQSIIDNAATRVIRGNGGNKIGLSKNSIKNYKTFLKKIKEFETYQNREIYFKDIDSDLGDKLSNWLLTIKKHSVNTSGKVLNQLVSVCNEVAINQKIKVNPNYKNIKSYTESDEDRYIVTLSLEELNHILYTEMPNNHLENAKKWLLIGCEIGQRGCDLLKLTKNKIRTKAGMMLIDLKQDKTKKEVSIPIPNEHVKDIILNRLPYPISDTKLNEYIKEVCRIAGITELTEGKLMNRETKRKVLGFYPKYQLISNHSFRRSFASNYYKKIPTPILMEITAHSQESIFLKYINKKADKDTNAELFYQMYHENIKPQQAFLKVLEN